MAASAASLDRARRTDARTSISRMFASRSSTTCIATKIGPTRSATFKSSPTATTRARRRIRGPQIPINDVEASDETILQGFQAMLSILTGEEDTQTLAY